MSSVRRTLSIAALAAGVAGVPTGIAFAAQQTPTTGQPGNPKVQCGQGAATTTPGNSANANGSPFNSSGTAGNHYAGNPGTASSNNSNSSASVSQYDIACGNVSSH